MKRFANVAWAAAEKVHYHSVARCFPAVYRIARAIPHPASAEVFQSRLKVLQTHLSPRARSHRL
jgi:hypothetical protein